MLGTAEVLEAEGLPQHECGVVAVRGQQGAEIGHAVVSALLRQQGRGQESAGGGVYGPEGGFLIAEQGLVHEVFPDADAPAHSINLLDHKVPNADTGIGQVRYSTSGDSRWVQPFRGEIHDFMLGHNGEVVNIRQAADEYGIPYHDDTSDSYLILRLVDAEMERNSGNLLDAVLAITPKLDGGFGLVFATKDQVIGVRDPWGNRPLVRGKRPDGSYFIASETIAFPEAQEAEDVQPGQVIVLDKEGMSFTQMDRKEQPQECVLERVYFAHPGSRMDGRTTRETRRRTGHILAEEELALMADTPEEFRIKPDIVLGAPNSAIPGAQGYAKAMGVRYVDGLYKSKNTRSFIMPTQDAREQVVSGNVHLRKEAADEIKDKIVAIVDDTVIRGTTVMFLTKLLRDAGAREVHVRVLAPPMPYDCITGVDISHGKTSLVARDTHVRQIASSFDVDSLLYLSRQGLATAIGKDIGELCMSCITGEYFLENVDTVRPHRSSRLMISRYGARKPALS